MKKSFRHFSIATILLVLSVMLPSNISAGVKAFLSYSTYYYPEEGPYMESYISINGESVKYVKQSNGKFQAQLEILFTFERNDSIKFFQKIRLNSPEITDTTSKSIINFMSIERFYVPEGSYSFNVSIQDMNTKDAAIKSKEDITVYYPKEKVALSGIQLLSSVEKATTKTSTTKHGYNIHPYFSNFFPDYINQITFYYEIYNTKLMLGEPNKFISRYYIQDATNKQKVNPFIFQKTVSTNLIDVSFGNFDISELPSGNYYLVIEALDTTGTILAFNNLFFQRSNPKYVKTQTYSNLDVTNTFVEKYTNFDTLLRYLDYLYPLTEDKDMMIRNTILMDIQQNMDSIILFKDYKKQKVKMMQLYLLDFWTSKNSIDPQKEWESYLEKVRDVNHRYSAMKTQGYQTDRGRVYLKYGAPNSISAEPMGADSYPYEIWHYYQVKGQGNRKFIFYNVDRAQNSYILLHSDVNGETYEPQWEKILRNRRSAGVNSDIRTSTPVWGDRSRDFWTNPR